MFEIINLMKKMCGFKELSSKLAFTLSELLIALAVVGILVAIVFPIVRSIVPDQNTLMAKRAFAVIQTAVSETINDNDCYPFKKGYLGFDDGHGFLKCKLWSNTSEGNAGEKFVRLLTDKMDLKSSAIINGDKATFTTKDGMNWTIQNLGAFSASNKNNKDKYVTISVDVNGPKIPNCGQSDVLNKCSMGTTKGFDIFTMRVYQTGKIAIEDSWAVSSVKVDKNLHNIEPSNGNGLNIQENESENENDNTEPEVDCGIQPENPGSNWIKTCCPILENPPIMCDECYPMNNTNLSNESCCEKYMSEADIWNLGYDEINECRGLYVYPTNVVEPVDCSNTSGSDYSKYCQDSYGYYLSSGKKYDYYAGEIKYCDQRGKRLANSSDLGNNLSKIQDYYDNIVLNVAYYHNENDAYYCYSSNGSCDVDHKPALDHDPVSAYNQFHFLCVD